MKETRIDKADHTGSDPEMITHMFTDVAKAERAYKLLEDQGYTREEIHVIMSDQTRDQHFKNKPIGNQALEGTGAGSAIGGTLGAVIGAIAAIGTNVLIPGLGIIIAGPLAAGLAGAGAGSLAGGLIGALVGAGIPDYKAKEYEEGIRRGSIVLGVYPKSTEHRSLIEREWEIEKEPISG